MLPRLRRLWYADAGHMSEHAGLYYALYLSTHISRLVHAKSNELAYAFRGHCESKQKELICVREGTFSWQRITLSSAFTIFQCASLHR